MDDVREGLTGIDRALAEALDVHPSPEFTARVRRRIASAPKPRVFWSGWRLAVPAAAAALLVTAVVLVRSQRGPSAQPVLGARSLTVGVMRPALDVPAPPVAAGASIPRIERAQVAAGRITPPEAEVLVPREQIEMYRRLIAEAQSVSHAVVVETRKAVVEISEAGVAASEIPGITIDPIKIDLITPPVGGEGDRQ